MNNILDYLKENTTTIHREVEQINLAKFIVDHSISKKDYQRLLLQNFTFYHTVHQAAFAKRSIINPVIHPFFDEAKSSNLKKDLSNLGITVPLNHFKKYDYEIQSENAAIGALYVSEGSALGGMVIGKHLAACAELEDIQKDYFFGGKAPTILARWKKFRQVIETVFNTTDHNKEEILKSANKTFELFGQIIRES